MNSSKRCVLVTGAGQGIGRAIANKFHAEGFHVVATDFNPELLEDLTNVDGYTTAKQDVSSSEDALALADKIQNELGRLDVIVNNAGVMDFYPVVEAPPQRTINARPKNLLGQPD